MFAPPLAEDSLAAALLAAASLVDAVQHGQALTDAWQQWVTQRLPACSNQGAVRDLASNTLRARGRPGRLLTELVPKPLPGPIAALMLVSIERLLSRPDQAHTLVDQAVDAVGALSIRHKGLANAVLRRVLREPEQVRQWIDADDEARECHPAWWIRRLKADWPRDWSAILAAGNGHPPMCLRVNRRRISRDAYTAQLQSAGIASEPVGADALWLPTPQPVSTLPGFDDGLISVQDSGAQLAGRLLAPQCGERVLDACAAPGGKTAHLLELADIELLALDLDPHRVIRITENLSRLSLHADVRVADAAQPDTWWDETPFDAVLADVPCSGSGVVRRHPDIKWLRRDSDIRGFADRQRAILDALWTVLKPGGRLLYVTCSMFDQENRAQVRGFLARHADARVRPIDGAADRILRPTEQHDGFYFAAFDKELR